ISVRDPTANSDNQQSKVAGRALVKSGAQRGGGKYFDATDAASLTTALTTVIAEIQAVNSVFASVSLPVSINTQSTYLNEIYMGMFRPDQTDSPRWLGNLKQYQIMLDSSTKA